MSTHAERGNEEPGALSPDRPVVDGTETTSKELRAQVEREVGIMQDERVQEIEHVREDLVETLDELSSRLDVRAHLRAAGRKAGAAGVVRAGVAAAVVAILVAAVVRRRRAA
jgi:hypothetical protein